MVDPPTASEERLWKTALRVAGELGPDADWCLIGGLMVQLYAYEHGAVIRPTRDIDILGNARRRPSMTVRIAKTLDGLDAKLTLPSRTSATVGYQFDLGGETVEVLGPDGLKADPKTIGGLVTIQVAGGTQALRRAEKVMVSVSGSNPGHIRRPTLLGAILLKARAAQRVRTKREEHGQDALFLLSLVRDPRESAKSLTRQEQSHLRRLDELLPFEGPSAMTSQDLGRARQAYELLVA